MKYAELEGKCFTFLISGGAGFIGSNLAIALIERGQKVVIIDSLITGKRRNVDDVRAAASASKLGEQAFRFVEGDIRNLDDCKKAVEGVDYVFHNAALGSVPRSIEDPVLSTSINVMGTLNMLVAARDARVKRFVFASSSSVYGDSVKLPKAEGSEGALLSPYAVGKKTNELYAGVFRNVYGLETIGLRYFNVFGPRQDTESVYAAVIPIFVKKLLSDTPPTINGDGETTRDFTYIDNVVQANVKAAFAKSDAVGRVYNIACSRRATLNELYDKIAAVMNKSAIRPLYGPERSGDIRHSYADISLAKKYLGYEPAIEFDEGLDKCINWYKKNL